MRDELLIVGGGIFLFMGAFHAVACVVDVFRPTQFTPADDTARVAMKSTTVRFSRRRANLWDAWLGFNISHGVGMIVFGAAVVWLALHFDQVKGGRGLLLTLPAIGLVYFVLAVRFWFYAPAVGFALATVCFAAAWWWSI